MCIDESFGYFLGQATRSVVLDTDRALGWLVGRPCRRESDPVVWNVKHTTATTLTNFRLSLRREQKDKGAEKPS
jgi:hypothetical protein